MMDRRGSKVERACMARFEEVVFAPTGSWGSGMELLEGETLLLVRGGLAVVEEREQGLRGDDGVKGEEVYAAVEEEQAGEQSLANDAIEGETIGIGSVLDLDLEADFRSQNGPSESDETVAEQDESCDLETTRPELLPQLDSRSNSLARSRAISHQPSCDSLRNTSALSATGMQSQFSFTPSTLNPDTQSDLSPELSLRYGSTGQYTVMSDMAETAWSVDDPRYGADVLDNLDTWDVSEPQQRLRDALIKRSDMDDSAPPVFSHRELTDPDVDVQGINWRDIGMQRADALRNRTYLQYPSTSHQMPDKDEPTCTEAQTHYKFHYFNGLRRPKYAHHQLRHVLASSGRDIFYANASKVLRAPLSLPTQESILLDLTKCTTTRTPIRITCLAATDSHLIAGGFDGEYALTSLDSPSPSHHEGHVTHDPNALVTHIHTHPARRSGLPLAAFCTNDQRLRLLDLTTQTFTLSHSYPHPLNAAATACGARMRAVVGDAPDALVTDAESGDVLATLKAHTDHIFACAWAPDDRVLATGAQDGKVVLWDARKWSEPLAVVTSALTCARSLCFSQDGGLLVSAENEDVVSVFDARGILRESGSEGERGGVCRRFRQDIQFLGTVAGVAMVDGGNEMVVANGDRSLGGLMGFRRTFESGGEFDEGVTEDAGKRRRRRAERKRRARGIGEGVVV